MEHPHVFSFFLIVPSSEAVYRLQHMLCPALGGYAAASGMRFLNSFGLNGNEPLFLY